MARPIPEPAPVTSATLPEKHLVEHGSDRGNLETGAVVQKREKIHWAIVAGREMLQ